MSKRRFFSAVYLYRLVQIDLAFCLIKTDPQKGVFPGNYCVMEDRDVTILWLGLISKKAAQLLLRQLAVLYEISNSGRQINLTVTLNNLRKCH